jgi:hypothetical protein
VATAVHAPITCQTRGPITIITYHFGATDEQYEAYLQELTAILEEGAKRYARLGQIHDASAWVRSSAQQRRLQAEWLNRNRETLRACGGFAAFVFKSALIRGGLTAVMWLANMPGPYKVCGTVQEALSWMEPRVIGGRVFPEDERRFRS